MLKKRTLQDSLLDIFVYTVIVLVNIVMIYPFVNIIVVSLSRAEYVVAGLVTIFPRGFNLSAYTAALSDPLMGRGYVNTLIYASTGTLLTLTITMITAYALSVRKFRGRNFFIVYMAITMYFSGGLIPYYLLIKSLNMIDTIWAMILPGVSVWYIIVCRTYFQSTIQDSLRESALIDGANDLKILTHIYIPLAKPIIATLGLWSVVAQWNSWFNALIFLNDIKLYPLQMVVRKVLIMYQPSSKMRSLVYSLRHLGVNEQTVRCAVIIITILPIVMIYPFIQKYFVKGVMVGALKG